MVVSFSGSIGFILESGTGDPGPPETAATLSDRFETQRKARLRLARGTKQRHTCTLTLTHTHKCRQTDRRKHKRLAGEQAARVSSS